MEHPAEVISIFDNALKEIAVSLGAPEQISVELRPYGLRKVIPMRDLNPSDIGKIKSDRETDKGKRRGVDRGGDPRDPRDTRGGDPRGGEWIVGGRPKRPERPRGGDPRETPEEETRESF